MMEMNVVTPYTSDNSVVAIDTDIEHPWQRVKLANQLAIQSSLDPEIRRLAGQVLKNCGNIYKNGSKIIAKWIRKNFIYLQESPGIEVLQGPYMSMYSGVMDCDDAAIMFVALTRAAGLVTYFCGIGAEKDPAIMLHAVGYDTHTGNLYELIDDSAYTRSFVKNGRYFRLPLDHFALCYTDEPGAEGFYVLPSKHPERFVKIDGIPELPEENGVEAMTCKGCTPMGKSETFPGYTSPGGTTMSPAAGETGSPADQSAGVDWTRIGESFFGALGDVGSAALGEPEQTVVYEEGDPSAPGYAPKEDNKMWWIIGGVAVGGLLLYTLMGKDEG